MINKKVLMIIIILSIFSISAVGAVEDNGVMNATDTVGDVEEVVENEKLNQNEKDQFSLESPDNGDFLGNDDDSFTALNNLVNGEENVIELTKDYQYKNNELVSHVTISKDNMVINGNGHTISGSNMTNAFLSTGMNVTINNVKIINTKIEKTYNVD